MPNVVQSASPSTRAGGQILSTYTLSHDGSRQSYDEAMAAATLQGLINRDAPRLYLLSRKDDRPRAWLNTFSQPGGWLGGKTLEPLSDLGALVKLAGKELAGR